MGRRKRIDMVGRSPRPRLCVKPVNCRPGRRFGRALGGILGLGAASLASAEVILDNVPDASYTAYGAQSQFAASGYVDVSIGSGQYVFGSATLVAPDWVLTAAHVVTEATSGSPAYDPSLITFGQGATAVAPAGASVLKVVVEPGWAGNLDAGNDLALIQLSRPITTVAPATVIDPSQAGNELGHGIDRHDGR
jgi:secreted trypsin-like serine protease